jgi:hypothetical protein
MHETSGLNSQCSYSARDVLFEPLLFVRPPSHSFQLDEGSSTYIFLWLSPNSHPRSPYQHLLSPLTSISSNYYSKSLLVFPSTASKYSTICPPAKLISCSNNHWICSPFARAGSKDWLVKGYCEIAPMSEDETWSLRRELLCWKSAETSSPRDAILIQRVVK